MDQPGCYVIVTSPSPDGTAFENVYVGQSLHGRSPALETTLPGMEMAMSMPTFVTGSPFL